MLNSLAVQRCNDTVSQQIMNYLKDILPLTTHLRKCTSRTDFCAEIQCSVEMSFKINKKAVQNI